MLVLPVNAYASYMGGPEVFQYFFGVFLLGVTIGIISSIKQNPEGTVSEFKFARFFVITFLSFVLALIAGFIGLVIGRP